MRAGINRRFSAQEILHIIKDTAMPFLMVHGDSEALLKQIITEIEALGVQVIDFGGDHSYALDYETLIASTAAEFLLPEVNPDAPAMYTYTSGTTGNPKGVILSDKALRKVIQMAPGTFGFSPDDIFIVHWLMLEPRW